MRSEYSTRQKREIHGFLQQHGLENFTLDEIVFRLQDQGTPIGRTTVYRYLESMAEQGSVRKYQNAQGVTQYQHTESGMHCDDHFHMMCRRCGRLYHVDCERIAALREHMLTAHGFELDARETMLVGVCARCAGRDRPEGEDGHGACHDEGRHGGL